jgi:hypothetical protein
MPSCFSWISRQLFTSCKGARETSTRRADGGHSGWMVEDKPATSTSPLPTTERCSSGRGATSPRFSPLNQQASADSSGSLFDPQPIRGPEYRVAKSASDSSALEAARTFSSGSRPIGSGETLSPPSLDSATDFGHGPTSDGRSTSSEQDQQSPRSAPPLLDTAPVPTGGELHAVSRWNGQGHPSMPTATVANGYFAHSTHFTTANFGLAKTLFERTYGLNACHFHRLTGRRNQISAPTSFLVLPITRMSAALHRRAMQRQGSMFAKTSWSGLSTAMRNRYRRRSCGLVDLRVLGSRPSLDPLLRPARRKDY